MYTTEATHTDLSGFELRELYEGVVTQGAAAPTDDVYVRIPQFDDDVDPRGTHRHGPCRWSPHPATGGVLSYPAVGNAALIAVSDLGNYWIVEWWPYG